MKKKDYFDPKNEIDTSRREHFSPSGRYKLVTSNFTTKAGCWSYSQGKVLLKDSDAPIAVIQRNYGSFPFLFVEGHANGHDYLIGGEDYQGQTVIELDTGRRLDHLPKEAKKGFGFCWIDYEYNSEHQILLVDGCFWACPYECRLYDFSNPMEGWPEIETTTGIDADRRRPVFNSDGTITCFQTEYDEDAEDDDEKFPPIAATTTFRRDGLKLIVAEEWVSEKEQQRRKSNEEARKKYDEWLKNFRETDPLYLEYKELVKDSALSPDDYESIGITYDGWCKEFSERESRMCRRIVKKSDKTQHTLDLEWGVKNGPIKLVVFKGGKHIEDKFFMDHSVESIRSAFDYAKSLLEKE